MLLNCEYIGINPNCSKQQRRSALAHELGHAIFDRKHAASGQAFQDTYFYSLSNAKAERRANTFAAELLLSDDYTGFINDTGKELPTIITFEDILEIGVNMT